MPRAISDRAESLLEMQPVPLRRSALFQAIAVAQADQFDKLDEALDLLRSNLIPASAEEWLGLWLRQLGASIASGASTADQLTAVLASLRRMVASGSGLDWKDVANSLLGTGWSYVTHQTGVALSSTNPAVHHVTIFVGGTIDANAALALFQAITPANTVVDVTYLTDDMTLDVGLLDVGALR